VDPGYIVFARDGTLLAQRFELTTAHAIGGTVSDRGTRALLFLDRCDQLYHVA